MNEIRAQGLIASVLAEALPPNVALMRLLLGGLPSTELKAALERHDVAGAARTRLRRLQALAASETELARLDRVVAADPDHGAAPDAANAVAQARAMFERLAAIEPEVAVAAYALGDPVRLARATAEVVSWLRRRALLGDGRTVLDLGCGIGRFCVALAPHVRWLVGIDIASSLLAEAVRRCAGLDNVQLVQVGGHDLGCFADARFDLILAADAFPYLVQASPTLAARHVAEAGRLLRPAGELVVLNYSYRRTGQDEAELRGLADAHRLRLVEAAPAGLSLWDAHAFRLRRAA